MGSSAPARLSLKQVAVLAILMAEAREITNTELRELAGVALTGTDRAGLTRLKLVQERKVGNTYAFELSPAGWSRCTEQLAAQSLANGAATGALSVLLRALHKGLAQQGTPASAFFGAGGGGDPGAETVAAPPAAAARVPVPAQGSDLESSIRAAYLGLAREPAGWVALADLRDELGDAPRTEVDAVLRRIAVQPGVRLIPIANLKSLTKRDREAALRLGGEENHAIAIEGR